MAGLYLFGAVKHRGPEEPLKNLYRMHPVLIRTRRFEIVLAHTEGVAKDKRRLSPSAAVGLFAFLDTPRWSPSAPASARITLYKGQTQSAYRPPDSAWLRTKHCVTGPIKLFLRKLLGALHWTMANTGPAPKEPLAVRPVKAGPLFNPNK